MNEELIHKGVNCLIKNLGYNEANEFLHQVVQNNIQYFDYTEWRREHFFERMNDEEIIEDAVKYTKNHNL